MKTLDFAFGEALRCDGMIHLIQAKGAIDLFMIKLLIIIPCSVIINNNKFNKLLILLLLLLILLGDTTKKSAKREI